VEEDDDMMIAKKPIKGVAEFNGKPANSGL
jgi:hypothetical protein